MPFGADPIVLTEDERRELRQITQSRTLPAGYVMRARMILLLSEGVSYRRIQSLLHTTAPTISRWKNRFVRRRVAGLAEERHPGQKPTVRTAKLPGSYLDGDQRWTQGRLHSLVVSQTGHSLRRRQRHDSTDSRSSRCPSASVGTLYGQ